MFKDSDLLGALRLDELQPRRIHQFPPNSVSMVGAVDVPEKTLLVQIGPDDETVGTWTRKGGLMVAHFKWAAPYSTRSVDEAYDQTVEMVRQYRRLRAGNTAT